MLNHTLTITVDLKRVKGKVSAYSKELNLEVTESDLGTAILGFSDAMYRLFDDLDLGGVLIDYLQQQESLKLERKHTPKGQ